MSLQRLCFALLVLLFITNASAQSTDTTLNEQNINGKWENAYLYISNYDEQCKVNSLLNKVWDAATQTWLNNSLSHSTYDNMGRPTEELIQNWDNSQQTWINSS